MDTGLPRRSYLGPLWQFLVICIQHHKARFRPASVVADLVNRTEEECYFSAAPSRSAM